MAASTRTATGSIWQTWDMDGLGDDTRHGCSTYGQAEVSNRGIVKALPDLKPKLFSHAQHGRVSRRTSPVIRFILGLLRACPTARDWANRLDRVCSHLLIRVSRLFCNECSH